MSTSEVLTVLCEPPEMDCKDLFTGQWAADTLFRDADLLNLLKT
jgi:hypothetical protein